MKTTQNSILLGVFEKHKGYSSSVFNNEEWKEFDAFIAGFECAMAFKPE